MSRREDERRKRSVSPGPQESEGGSRKRGRYSDGGREDQGPHWDHWQESHHPDSHREPHRDPHRDLRREGYRDQRRDSPPRRQSPRRSPSRRDDGRDNDSSFRDRRRQDHGPGPRGDFPGAPMPGPPAPGGFPPAPQGGRGRMGGPPMPPGASPRGRGNFQAFIAGGRQGYDGGRGGSFFRGRGREPFQGRFPDGGFRGRRGGFRGGRFEGDFGRRGRGSMHPGRSFPQFQAPPNLPGVPRPPPIDPAVLERRKQSTARLLRRQLANVELNPDLVDEALYERFLELKTPQGMPPDKDAAPCFRIEDSFMWDCLGGDEAAQESAPEQRYDQSEAFEYCLQLYQSVSKIQPSKFGHYIV